MVGRKSSTVTVTLSETPFAVAVIVTVPAFLAVTFPLLTEATLLSLEVHLTEPLLPVTELFI